MRTGIDFAGAKAVAGLEKTLRPPAATAAVAAVNKNGFSVVASGDAPVFLRIKTYDPQTQKTKYIVKKITNDDVIGDMLVGGVSAGQSQEALEIYRNAQHHDFTSEQIAKIINDMGGNPSDQIDLILSTDGLFDDLKLQRNPGEDTVSFLQRCDSQRKQIDRAQEERVASLSREHGNDIKSWQHKARKGFGSGDDIGVAIIPAQSNSDQPHFAALADGMGGHDYPLVASHTFTDGVANAAESYYTPTGQSFVKTPAHVSAKWPGQIAHTASGSLYAINDDSTAIMVPVVGKDGQAVKNERGEVMAIFTAGDGKLGIKYFSPTDVDSDGQVTITRSNGLQQTLTLLPPGTKFITPNQGQKPAPGSPLVGHVVNPSIEFAGSDFSMGEVKTNNVIGLSGGAVTSQQRQRRPGAPSAP